MTTPAHCTRTDWPHEPHPLWETNVPGIWTCSGVEPPADVAATPDPSALPWDGTRHTSDDVMVGMLDTTNGNPDRRWSEPSTPDSRLDVVIKVMRETAPWTWRERAQRILDALDDLAAQTMHEPDIADPAAWASGSYHRADQCPTIHDLEDCHTRVAANLGCAPAQTMHEPNDRMQDGPCGVMPTYHVDELFSAPAGLTPAQEIRLRLVEHEHNTVNLENGYLDSVAAWVEHGPDETPDSTPMTPTFADLQRRLGYVRDDLNSMRVRALAAEARADLAEARLGHIADALRDHGRGPSDPLDVAISDCLEWTPDDTATEEADTRAALRAMQDRVLWRDDTATASTRDPNCIAQWPECVSGGYDPRCCRFPKSCSCESWTTAGADTTGDE